MDCINCTNRICIKGHKDSNERIRQRKVEVEESLKIAEEAQRDGHVGAHRWVTHKTIELQKLTQLCEIFDNDNVKKMELLFKYQKPLHFHQSNKHKLDCKKRTGETAIDMDEMRNLLKNFQKD